MQLKKRTTVAFVLVGALGLSACGGGSDEDSIDAETVNQTDQIDSVEDVSEAPELAERVEAGELPELAERMPVAEDIMVHPVEDQIGEYGGTWNMGWNGQSLWAIGKPTEEALFRFNREGDGVEPNVAKGYDVNEDFTEWTIHLREGMRWSDGEPFTSNDVIFWWEHIMKPEIFGRSVYDAFYSVDQDTEERTMAEMEAPDDHTVVVTFDHPNVMFLERVAIDAKWMFAPAHYMENILDEFIGEEAALEIAQDHGMADLESWYEAIAYYFWVWPDRPSIRAWVPTATADQDFIVWERNPYYWKTDPAGNQLPYISEVHQHAYTESDQILLDAMAGNLDIAQFDFADYTVLRENEASGDYRVLEWPRADWFSNGIQFNMEPQDENLRGLFHDERFREALSVAVDREELSEILTLGLGEPIQASIAEGQSFYQEGWGEQWAEYDVDRANDLLDEIGLEWDGNSRVFEDGSPVRFTITQETDAAQAGQLEELLQNYYQEIGVVTDIELVDRGRFGDINSSGELEATTSYGVGGIHPVFRPDTVVPLRPGTPWHVAYGEWYATGGAAGIEPEGEIAELISVYEQMRASTDPADIDAFGEQIIQLHMENQWVLGYTGPTPTLFAVSNDIVNVPEEDIIFADEFRDLGHAHPAQFSFINQD